jgi:D-alanyl-D-alanine carboxypeptidase (penicillin-binding protein 5/6)
MRHVQKHPVRNTFVVISIVVFTVFSAGLWNILRPLPAVALQQNTPAVATSAATPVAWPVSGMAAVKAVGVSGLLTHGEQKAAPTASIAKVITALTVLKAKPMEAGDLGPTLTLTQADLDIYHKYVAVDGSTVHVAPGEQLNQYQALQAMMLPSANNVADSVAIWAFGSLENYHTAATEYIKEIGMANTTIGPDASGMSPLTTSTPSDLVLLGEQAMAHPVLAQIVGQKEATIPVEGKIYNTNATLGQAGIVGIKTGTTDEAGGNLLFAAKTEVAPEKVVTIVGVVMGQPDRVTPQRVTPPLVSSVAANLYVATPVRAGVPLATYTTKWGETATASAKKDIAFIAWKGEDVTPKITMQRTAASYTEGATVGTVSATAGNSAGTADVVMSKTIGGPSLWWRLTRH